MVLRKPGADGLLVQLIHVRVELSIDCNDGAADQEFPNMTFT